MSKKKSGYFTRFPNSIYDFILAKDLTATQLKILLAVIRNTYGWDVEYCKLSLSKLEEITNCSRRQIMRDIKKLIDDKMLLDVYQGRDRLLKFNEAIIKQ